MTTFESLHPRSGGTGPDRTQFAARTHPEADVTLETAPPAEPIRNMEDAPTDGEVIEALFEGEWYEVHWSQRAYDGSPYGTKGWATLEDTMLMMDLEGWRPAADENFVDEDANFRAEAESRAAAEEAKQAEQRKADAARRREASRRNREYFEEQYKHLTGTDITAERRPMVQLRREVNALSARNALATLSKVMQDFR
jgi:hypothetical protein